MKKRLLFVVFAALSISQYAEAQWQSIGPSTIVESLAFSSDGVLYAGTEHGVYRRNPQTFTWEARSVGLPDLPVAALVADPQTAGVLYAGDLRRLSGSGGIFRTTDGGLTWAPASAGLTDTIIQALAIDPANPATLYAGTNSGGVMKSTDGAGHWTATNSGLTNLFVASIAIDPRNTSTLYAGTGDGVFKSTDGGNSWIPKNVGLRAELMPYTAAGFAIDPTNSSTLYLASFVPVSVPIGGGAYKSTNGGDTWAPINNGMLFLTALSAIALDARSPATLFVAAQFGGVARTTDGGAHWSDVSAGLPYPVIAFTLDPNIIGTVYAATRGGVFQLTSGTGNMCVPGPDALCLNNGRFKVQVNWRVGSQALSGTGKAALMTSDTGSFWFFSSNNVELVVKVVDGRAFNNRFWVFYGALTNVEYTITVTDTVTGAVKTYFNPQGQLASIADTAAFPP